MEPSGSSTPFFFFLVEPTRSVFLGNTTQLIYGPCPSSLPPSHVRSRKDENQWGTERRQLLLPTAWWWFWKGGRKNRATFRGQIYSHTEKERKENGTVAYLKKKSMGKKSIWATVQRKTPGLCSSIIVFLFLYDLFVLK